MQLADGDTPPATAPRRGPRRRRAAGSRALVRARRRSAPRGQRRSTCRRSTDASAINRVAALPNRVHNTPMELRPATDADVAAIASVARRQLEPQLPRRLLGRVPRPRGARRAARARGPSGSPTRARTNARSSRCTTASSSVSSTPLLDDDPTVGRTARQPARPRRLAAPAAREPAGRGVRASRRRRAPRPRPVPLGARGQRPRPRVLRRARAAQRSNALEEEAVDGTPRHLPPRRLARPDRLLLPA